MYPFPLRLLRLRFFLTWPGPRRLGESTSGTVIGETFDQAEDRTLKEQCGDQLWPREFPMLGPRRLLVVDQAPEPFEDLLSHQPGEQPGEKTDRRENELHHQLPSGVGSECEADPKSEERRSSLTASATP